MDLSKQQKFQGSEIVCDRIVYQKLQSLEQNQTVNLSLFPHKTQGNNQFRFVFLDSNKQKANESSKTSIFKQEEFLQLQAEITNEKTSSPILTYNLTKQSVDELINQNGRSPKLIWLQARELNLLMRNCIIMRLKLPNGFYQIKDTVFSFEGYRFNEIGQLRENWGLINNGRVIKDVFLMDDEKVKQKVKKNVFYTKGQVNKMIEQIIRVNNGVFDGQKTDKSWQQINVLGENFIHSQMMVKNANCLLPVLSFEAEIVCSMGRGENQKNKICAQNQAGKNGIEELICLNLEGGVEKCVKEVELHVQRLFTNRVAKNENDLRKNSLFMSTIPLKIVNPHMFLKTETKDKFSQYFVKGLYEYFHYGDHSFNDQGWGCAYRSLETLLSWFRLQQKLHLHSVPTIPEIQNIIDLIDCTSETKLSNSKTWIGATEVSWVVKRLTGFDCRILHIKDGKDIVEQAEIFRQHLENVGSPIMYGGDEYAYSIVGINYSWKLGEIQFCILDPHYNGSDKIEKIIEKKGVCWRKPQEMFKKGVFYNFCLPIV